MFRLVGRHRIMGAIRSEERITLVMTVLKAKCISAALSESQEPWKLGGRAMI
jgi:hypothetical protein